MRRIKILVTGTNTTLDNGEAAISSTAIKGLMDVVGNVEFAIGSTDRKTDCERWRKMLPKENSSINVFGIDSPKIPRSVRAMLLVVLYFPMCWKADVCLDISGDGYSDVTQHGMFGTISHSIQLLIGILLGKPVIVYAQSIGPFKNRLTRFLARFALNGVDLVTVREDLTEKYLERLGVNRTKLMLTGDSAFLLEPVSPQEAESILAHEHICSGDHVLAGMAVSRIIHRWAFPNCKRSAKYDTYTDVMAKIADYMVERLGAIVILISQTGGDSARHDDQIAAVHVWKKTRNKDCVKVILGQYVPQEIKGIIGHCQLMVSSKMHSAIAAASMFVPTVVLAYSHKTHGIFGERLGLEKLIVDLTELDSDEVLAQTRSKIDLAWESKDEITHSLRERVAVEKKRALMNVHVVADFLRSKC